jgi:hypothetical protein
MATTRGQRTAAASTLRSERALRLRQAARTHSAFLVVLGVGVLLRLYLFFAYRPLAGEFSDSVTYLATSGTHLFADASRMAGYPLFLRILRDVSPHLSFVIAFQHLLGLATGVLLYALTFRVTRSRVLALIPSAFFLLSGDYLLLEHSLLTETVYIFLVTAGLTGVVFAATTESGVSRRFAYVAGSAGVLAIAWTIRTTAFPVLVLAGVWAAWTCASVLRERLKIIAAFFVPAGAVVVTYIALQGSLTGYWGVLPGSGWALYTRVAPIADCNRFDPPKNTAFLCETTAIRTRPGPAYYQYVGGPGLEHFGNPFQTNAKGSGTVGRFARAVILAEPLSYLREVGRDMVRYISATAGLDRPYSGAGEDELDLTRRDPAVELATIQEARVVGFHAGNVTLDGGVQLVAEIQPMLRVTGLAALALLVLACMSLVFGKGIVRSAGVLLLAAAILQPLMAVATLVWGYRYGVVGAAELVVAAMLGVSALLQRMSPA